MAEITSVSVQREPKKGSAHMEHVEDERVAWG